jgi:hypothetical protein
MVGSNAGSDDGVDSILSDLAALCVDFAISVEPREQGLDVHH